MIRLGSGTSILVCPDLYDLIQACFTMEPFKKRIYNYRSFKKDLIRITKNLPSLFKTFRARRISFSFAKKIFLAVSAVNGCTYCLWFHTKVALIGGMDPKEIKKILSIQLHKEIDDYEIMGIAYAKYYAETDENPDPDMTKRFYDFYGKERADDIMLYIQAVSFANLSGNTFDAFINRFKGEKVPDSRVWFELLIFLLSAPLIVPLLPFVKKKS